MGPQHHHHDESGDPSKPIFATRQWFERYISNPASEPTHPRTAMAFVAVTETTTLEWAAASAVIIGGIAAAAIAGRGTRQLIERTGSNAAVAIIAGRVISYLAFLTSCVYALNIIDLAIGPLLGALGIGGLVVAFALQSILENIVAGILLHARRPFVIGDEIRTNDHAGTVRDITARTVVVDTYIGERVHIPNIAVVKEPIVNATTHPDRRLDLTVRVALDTDLSAAEQVITYAVTPHSCRPPEVHATSFADFAVEFTVMVWHPASEAQRWKTRHATTVAIHQALHEARIVIPLPHRTITIVPTTVDDEGTTR
jgi:small-conductance mechanosensitive channel